MHVQLAGSQASWRTFARVKVQMSNGNPTFTDAASLASFKILFLVKLQKKKTTDLTGPTASGANSSLEE